MIRTVRRSLLLTSLLGVVVVIVLGSWIAYRALQYSQLEPLRNAVSLVKEGKSNEAIPVLEKFAKDGDLSAMLTLGEVFAYGIGVPYDERRAALWARRASSTCEGNALGSFEYAIASTYLRGERGAADPKRGVAWLKRAAEAGNFEAQRQLAERAGLGEGIGEVDDETAEYWAAFLRSVAQ